MDIDKTNNRNEKGSLHPKAAALLASIALTAGIGTGAAINKVHKDNQPVPIGNVTEHTLTPDTPVWDVAKAIKNPDSLDGQTLVDVVEEMSPDLQDGTADAGDTALVPDEVRKAGNVK